MTDVELVKKAQTGDYPAFEDLVRRYQDRVYRLALGMIQVPAEAEEVVQDTFLNIFKNIKEFRGDAAISSWIFRVTANTALMALRRQRRKPHLSLEDAGPDFSEDGTRHVQEPTDWTIKPNELVLSGELKELIQTTMANLPEKYRLVLLLKDVEGLSNEEVAEALGLTVPTVKARLHRSRLIVRDQLDHYFRNQ